MLLPDIFRQLLGAEPDSPVSDAANTTAAVVGNTNIAQRLTHGRAVHLQGVLLVVPKVLWVRTTVWVFTRRLMSLLG